MLERTAGPCGKARQKYGCQACTSHTHFLGSLLGPRERKKTGNSEKRKGGKKERVGRGKMGRRKNCRGAEGRVSLQS